MSQEYSSKFFTDAELACPASGLVILAPNFLENLDKLRIEFGHPMKVNSACRSTAHNKRVRGALNSFHICDTGRGCCAIDIATPTPLYRTKLARMALDHGWSVGVAKTFLHLDMRTQVSNGKAPQVIFSY